MSSPRPRLHTFALPPGPPIDAVALAGADGVLAASPSLTLAGQGTALTAALPFGLEDGPSRGALAAEVAALSGEDHVGTRGTGAVAFTALPFHPGTPGRVLVPHVLYGRNADGQEWVTVATAADATPSEPSGGWRQHLLDLTRRRPPVPSDPAGQVVELHEVPSGSEYRARVAEARARIAAGELEKVVLGRALDLRFAEPIDIARVLRSIHDQEPSCWAFVHPVPGGAFLGASPELLVARRGERVACHPLAGTTGTAPEAAGGQLLGSAKERAEHRYAVEQIADVLAPACTELSVPEEPSLVHLGSLSHLGTPITGRLRRERGALPHILDILAALHPTPAVGGTPKKTAIDVIAQLEGQPRAEWAGPVGWFDSGGDGELVIGIRSVTVRATWARLWAGAGIVAGSEPAAELAETSLKFEAVLRALTGRPGVPSPA